MGSRRHSGSHLPCKVGSPNERLTSQRLPLWLPGAGYGGCHNHTNGTNQQETQPLCRLLPSPLPLSDPRSRRRRKNRADGGRSGWRWPEMPAAGSDQGKNSGMAEIFGSPSVLEKNHPLGSQVLGVSAGWLCRGGGSFCTSGRCARLCCASRGSSGRKTARGMFSASEGLLVQQAEDARDSQDTAEQGGDRPPLGPDIISWLPPPRPPPPPSLGRVAWWAAPSAPTPPGCCSERPRSER